MKTASFGVSSFMIVIITLILVLEINMSDSRQQILEDNLSDAMTASMKMAIDDRGYSINTNEELITDVIEYLALFVTNDCSIDVEVIEADLSTGILSLKVTEYYTTTFGKVDSIEVTRTVLVDDYTVDIPNSYNISYVIRDARGTDVLFKQYVLQEGSTILVPSTTNYNINIKGWCTDPSNPSSTEKSSSEIQAMPLDKDYTFYAIL